MTSSQLVLVVARLRPSDEEAVFVAAIDHAVAAFASRPGFVSSRLARSLDDASLWVLVMEFDNVGNYRRSLSSYDVRMASGVLMGAIIDEPTAYEEIPLDGRRDPA